MASILAFARCPRNPHDFDNGEDDPLMTSG
jgi:hypothetical protein